MAGMQPLEPHSSPPGAFPETPAPNDEQQFSVNPLPAPRGPGNPDPSDISSRDIVSNVKLDEASYNKSDAGPIPADKEQTYSVNPLPAAGGIGNPIHLEPGEKVPDPSTYTSNTTTSNVKLDEASYNASDSGAPFLPPALSPDSEKEAWGEKAIFGGLGPQTSNMIPESSMGMGKEAPGPISDSDMTPNVSSVGPQSSTAQMAGMQPLESQASREPPAIVTESQKEANFEPEAAASPRALQEKDELESELQSKVPEAPAASEGTATGSPAAPPSHKGLFGMAAGGLAAAGTAAAGYAYSARDKATKSTGKDPVSYLPQSVQDSISNMNSKGSTAPSAPAAEPEKSLVEHAPVHDEDIPQQTHVGDAIEVPAQGTSEAQGTTALDTGVGAVPEEVTHSQREAGVDPEAAASPVAVDEKSAVERELLSKVPESTAAGESAPSFSAGEGAGMAAAGVGAAGLGAAGYASYQSHEAASGVPEPVVESQRQAHVDPEAAAVPEAVQEKSAVESELLSKIPASTAAGESAPSLSAGAGAGIAAAGVGAAGLGAAGYASYQSYQSHQSPEAASGVPEPVVESQKQAHVDPEAAAVPEA
ncbi:hypothetical protein LTR53_017283, partial [Teratosphaeriaceae sp. CCFEE 6253]